MFWNKTYFELYFKVNFLFLILLCLIYSLAFQFFWCCYLHKKCFSIVLLSTYVFLNLKYVSYKQHIVGLWFFWPSDCLWLLIILFNSVIFNANIDTVEFIYAI